MEFNENKCMRFSNDTKNIIYDSYLKHSKCSCKWDITLKSMGFFTLLNYFWYLTVCVELKSMNYFAKRTIKGLFMWSLVKVHLVLSYKNTWEYICKFKSSQWSLSLKLPMYSGRMTLHICNKHHYPNPLYNRYFFSNSEEPDEMPH